MVRPPPRPGPRRSTPRGGSSVASEIREAQQFTVFEQEGSFAILPLDAHGRAVNLHPLGGATYPTRKAALEAIERYRAAEERARAAEDD